MNRYTLTLGIAASSALSLLILDGEQFQHSLENAIEVMATPAITEIAAEELVAPESKPDSDEPNVDTTAQIPETEEPTTDEPEQLAFEPPFPDRSDLFQAPKRLGKSRTGDKGQQGSAVELLGFVNVGGQRVALSIDGLVTTIAEGGEEYGIEVISIQPPSVVLQRGRQRWQASFEN